MRILVCAFLILGLSCKTNDSAESDGEDASVSFEFNKDFPDTLPPSLWSPTRRKVSASYYFLVAEYEAMSGRDKKAGELYSAAYGLEPSPFLGQKMVASVAANGGVDTALLHAKKLSLMYPKKHDIRSLYGRLLLQKGAIDKAEVEFRQSIILEPNTIEGYFGLIGVYQHRELIPKAIEIARKMLARNPDFAEGWGVLAKLYLSSTNKKLALKPAKRAYELRSQDPEKVLIYALALEINGQSKKSVHLYEILFRLNPTNEELIQRMVGLYRQIGGLQEALSLLEEAILKRPSDGIRLQQAFIYWELKNYKKASEILTGISDRNPDSDRNRYMAALGYEKIRNYDGAVDFFLKLDRNSSLYLHARYRAVNILRRLKRFEQAIEVIEEALELKDPNAVEFFRIGAHIYADLKREQEALTLLQRGWRDYPGNIELLFLIGVYYEKVGERTKCIETMQEVIAKKGNHHSALNFLGYLYAEKGENLEEAESLINKALKIKPNDGFYKDSLGWVYFQKQNYVQAEKILLEAISLVPGEGVILEHLGDVALATGKTKDALKYYEKAVKSRLDKRDRARVENKLSELQKQESEQ